MLKRPAVIVVVLLTCSFLTAQHNNAKPSWDGLRFLVGNWVGEGTAETGQLGAGYCSFELVVQDWQMIRKNHSEYPATKDHPAISHDDLMIIYRDYDTGQLRAFYTDSEGHVIPYTVTPYKVANSDVNGVVFLGDVEEGKPRFRLTYTLSPPDHITIAFEMAPPGKPEQFQKIIDGKMRKADGK